MLEDVKDDADSSGLLSEVSDWFWDSSSVVGVEPWSSAIVNRVLKFSQLFLKIAKHNDC